MKQVKLNKSLLQDVYNVCGSMYSMNAPHAIGYLFNPTLNRKSISTGMFCDFEREINSNSWTYFLNYKDKTIYKIYIKEGILK